MKVREVSASVNKLKHGELPRPRRLRDSALAHREKALTRRSKRVAK